MFASVNCFSCSGTLLPDCWDTSVMCAIDSGLIRTRDNSRVVADPGEVWWFRMSNGSEMWVTDTGTVLDAAPF